MKKKYTASQMEEIRKEFGIEPPRVKEQPGARFQLQERRLLEFAAEHKIIITPVGYGYFVDCFLELHCCPCAPERKACPCPESIDEIREKGRCRCTLFWKDYETFMKERL